MQHEHAFIETILNLIPSNIFAAMARGEMLPIIFFSVLFGLGLSSLQSDLREPLVKMFQGVSESMFKVTHMIMNYAPIGVFALIAVTVANFGFASLLPLAKLVILVYVAIAFYAFVVLAFGKHAAAWLRERVTIGRGSLMVVQMLLGIYGGYFGGGVGLMTTATYGLLAGHSPRELFAPRTLMLAIANFAAAIVFIAAGMVRWIACLPMLAGSILGGWAGAHIGKRLPASAVRVWTLLVTGVTTIVFFARAYG